MRRLSPIPILVGTVCTILAAAASAKPPVSGRAAEQNQCFYSNQYQNFRAINDHSFYIRVNVDDVYRIDLSGSCPELTYPDSHLITVIRGSNLICGPVDWDLRVGEPGPGGFAVPCIVSGQTKLSKEEAAAIPRKLKP